jgi:glycosyltransferase involved in cell wall biosynthesis
MKSFLKNFLRYFECKYYRVLNFFGFHKEFANINFVVEKTDWAIRQVGLNICENININHPGFTEITTKPAPIINNIIHFGSQYQWLLWESYVANDNKIIVSFFHGKSSDGDLVKKHIDKFLLSVPRLSKIITGANLIKRRLIDWGIEPSKIIKIPIGCDTSYFIPPSIRKKKIARKELGVPDNAICIGSYQKDGIGWGDGLEPKYIKGPDIFISVVSKLAKQVPVFVLLTGPARGYVKKELEKNSISYYHSYLTDYKEILDFYHALDLYLVTSREEGGPMALMESMATHVPVVSTKVGQAEDLIHDKVTGGLVDVDDIGSICERALHYINLDSDKKEAQLKEARKKVVDEYDWKLIAEQHYSKVYMPLVDNK